MFETTTNLPDLAERANGEAAMSRLADRLVAMAPPANGHSPMNHLPLDHSPLDLSPKTILRQSPAVAAALSASAAIAKRADERARRSRSVIGLTVDSFISACSFIPYALVALALRLIMARVFFLDGQTRVDGIRLPLNLPDLLQSSLQGSLQGSLHWFDFSVVLPMSVRPETFAAFLTQYPQMPIPPAIAAYAVSYAEFVLPIMLVAGLGTRFAALSLLVMTAIIQIYVQPEALWSVHIYWMAMLTVLLSLGAGQISIDHIIRYVARR